MWLKAKDLEIIANLCASVAFLLSYWLAWQYVIRDMHIIFQSIISLFLLCLLSDTDRVASETTQSSSVGGKLYIWCCHQSRSSRYEI